jgi:aminopeptidase C
MDYFVNQKGFGQGWIYSDVRTIRVSTNLFLYVDTVGEFAAAYVWDYSKCSS